MNPWKIKRIRLAKLLQKTRFYSNATKEYTESRLLDILKRGLDTDSWEHSDIVRLYQQRGVRGLEDASSLLAGKEVSITLDELQWLADGYQVKRILFDPVLSKPVANCVSSPSDAIQVDGGHEGMLAKYLTPNSALDDSESQTAIAFAEIAKDGKSDLHHHTGEELIAVLRGDVEVMFPDSGLSARLTQHDHCHFNSTQKHFVANRGDQTAVLLAVRRWPSRSRSQLESQLAEFEDQIKAATGKPVETPKDFARIRQLFQEIKLILVDQSFDSVHSTNESQIDRSGLGRYLSYVANGADDTMPMLSLNTLADRGKKFGLTRSRFQSIQSGKARIAKSELIAIADCYHLLPALLYEFMIPQHGPTVVMRAGKASENNKGDFSPLPDDFAKSTSANYLIPNRRLRLTNLSVCKIELAPSAKTAPNEHPGQELVIPLSGSIKVRVGGFATPALPSSNFYFVHFNSVQEHVVENASNDKPASALVIRMCNF